MASPLSEVAAKPDVPAWSPFRHGTFTILWLATVTSNVGSWMQNAAAGWLMTSLDPDPRTVALVQAAMSLPMFLFSLPAGALADIVDRRRLLLGVQVALMGLVGIFSLALSFGLVTPDLLLIFVFLSGIGAVMIAPAWQSIVPQLVPRSELAPAVALNGVGVNISRAIGPALAGFVIGVMGLAAPFWINAGSTIAVIAALLWWRSGGARVGTLPAEHVGRAVVNGVRFARNSPDLRATLIRASAFFPLASVYWALLPLVARQQIGGGPQLYGLLLGAIGAGAVVGAFGLAPAKARFGADRIVEAGTVLTALAIALFAIAREPIVALIACVIAGIAWISVMATFSVSAQVALPEWVRGRGLAVFASVQFAGLTLGSLVFGYAAHFASLWAVHLAAAAGLLVSVPLLRRWHLQGGAGFDLTPSMHWPTPVLPHEIDRERGPVLVTVEYEIAPEKRDAFIAAIAALGAERRRDGAFRWRLFEDPAREGIFVETFLLDSWLDHLRQHERVTNADRIVQDVVRQFHAAGEPVVRHLVASEGSPYQSKRISMPT